MGCNRNTINCTIERGKDRPPCCIEGFKNLLFYVTSLFDEYNITYWLDYGTLLGAIRNSELILWDTDIDLGILDTEVDKILGLFLNDKKSEYDYAVHMANRQRELVPIHHVYVFYSKVNRLSLDISVWDDVNGVLRRRRWFEHAERAMGREFSKKFVEPLENVTMYNKQFKCPNNTEEFLSFRYGPNWRVPTCG